MGSAPPAACCCRRRSISPCLQTLGQSITPTSPVPNPTHPRRHNTQMPLIYSAVARGGAVLAEYSVFAGNFAAVAKDYLSKSSSAGRFSYTVDNHVFSFLADDGYSEWRLSTARRRAAFFCPCPGFPSAL
jgi:hypothetical protein